MHVPSDSERVECVDLAERGTTGPTSGGTALVQSMTDTGMRHRWRRHPFRGRASLPLL
jgi:hypothetical protein